MSNPWTTSPKHGNKYWLQLHLSAQTRHKKTLNLGDGTDNVSVCRTLKMLQRIQNPRQKCCQTDVRHLLLEEESFPWAVVTGFLCGCALLEHIVNPDLRSVCKTFLNCAITSLAVWTGCTQDRKVEAPQCLVHSEVNKCSHFKCQS